MRSVRRLDSQMREQMSKAAESRVGMLFISEQFDSRLEQII